MAPGCRWSLADTMRLGYVITNQLELQDAAFQDAVFQDGSTVWASMVQPERIL